MAEGLAPVDYDRALHDVYGRARFLSDEAAGVWMASFTQRAPGRRPLAVLDLGSGTGRFTTALQREFGGPTYGVEPAAAMRRQAPPAPGVTYLAGRAEQIPLPDASCDLVLMFLSLHHVQDRPAAGRELARVLRGGGRLVIRTALGDQLPDLLWYRFYPEAGPVEERLFPTLAQVEAMLPTLRLVAHDHVAEPYAPSLTEYAERLKLHAISTFEYLTPAEIAAGDARLDAAVAAGEHQGPVSESVDLLTFAAP